MKHSLIFLTALLAGCATTKQQTHLVKPRFGQEHVAIWNQQISAPNSSQNNQTPSGLEGSIAEKIMQVYIDSFTEKPTNSNILNLKLTPND